MSQNNQTNAATRSEEIRLGGSESTPLRSRQSVKPSDPGYDANVLAHIKRLIVIDPAKGCWLWQGFVYPDVVLKNGKVLRRGYGSLGYRGRGQRVHRVMWIISKGPIPAGLHVCHTCDVRRCVNPDHLWLGTNQQNITDMTLKGRGPCGEKKMKTHCIRGHELAGDNLIIFHGGKHRGCKTCSKEVHHKTQKHVEWRRAYQRKRRAAKRAARMAQQGAAP